MDILVRFRGRAPVPRDFDVANQWNNLVDRVLFELPAYEGATAFLHLVIGDYTDIVRLPDEGIFTLTRTHTQYSGRMEGWVEIVANNDIVWNSDPFVMRIGRIPDDGEQIEQAYPTAIEEALRAVDVLTGVQAEARTLPPGSAATVNFREDESGQRTIIYGIPRGRDGTGSGFSYEIGHGLKVEEDGVTLAVDTADVVEKDNTLPITSAAVHVTVGNINALLETI